MIREIEFVLTLSKEGLGTSAPSIFKCASAPVSFPYRPWALCCSAWFGGLSTMENFVQWMNERIKERRQQVLKAHKHKHRPGDVVYPVCNVQVQCYTNHALLFTYREGVNGRGFGQSFTTWLSSCYASASIPVLFPSKIISFESIPAERTVAVPQSLITFVKVPAVKIVPAISVAAADGCLADMGCAKINSCLMVLGREGTSPTQGDLFVAAGMDRDRALNLSDCTVFEPAGGPTLRTMDAAVRALNQVIAFKCTESIKRHKEEWTRQGFKPGDIRVFRHDGVEDQHGNKPMIRNLTAENFENMFMVAYKHIKGHERTPLSSAHSLRPSPFPALVFYS